MQSPSTISSFSLSQNPIIKHLGILLPPDHLFNLSIEEYQKTRQTFLLAVKTLVDRLALLQEKLSVISKKQENLKAAYTQRDLQVNELTTVVTASEQRTQQLLSNLTKLENDDTTTDIAFVVGDERIRAHSTIVSHWSSPLERMLQSMMREGVSREITIQAEETSTVKSMINYIYTADTPLNINNALPLLRLAALFDISPLRDKCCKFLVDNINASNCIQLFSISTLHKIENIPQWEDLESRSIAFIMKSPSEALAATYSPFADLDQNQLAQIIPVFLQKATRETKQQLCKAFLLWTKEHWDAEDFSQCLSHSDKLEHNHAQAEKKLEGEGAQKLDATTSAASTPPSSTLKVLHNFCMSSIFEDFEVQSKLPGFLLLNLDNIVHILEKDDLVVRNELFVLNAVAHWLQANPERYSPSSLVVEHIRFPFIPAQDLVAITTSHPVIAECSSFKAFLQEAIQLQMDATTGKPAGKGATSMKRRAIKRRLYTTIPTIDTSFIASFVANSVAFK